MHSFTLVLVILLCFYPGFISTQLNNVCKDFVSYATLPFNKNCWYNPNIRSSPEEMVRRNGYPVETHRVITDDGYILTVYRIPHNNQEKEKDRIPVYLYHGILESAEVFLDVGNRSLAYVLSEEGYDVWLGNARGSPHGLEHVNLTTKNSQFWNFSFHEIGIYDLPATIKYIREKTESKYKIIYLGYSMGTAVSYVYCSIFKEEAEKNLAGLVSLAPIAYLGGMRVLLYQLIGKLWKPIYTLLLSINKVALFNYFPEEQNVFSSVCSIFGITPICKLILMYIIGPDNKQLTPQDIPLIYKYFLVTTSTKLFIHFEQIVGVGDRFQLFDYGLERNIEVYGNTQPPEYNLTAISLPTFLIHGKNDFLSVETDVEKLYEKLKTNKTIDYIAPDGEPGWNHFDFIYAKDLQTLLYPLIIKKLGVLKDYV